MQVRATKDRSGTYSYLPTGLCRPACLIVAERSGTFVVLEAFSSPAQTWLSKIPYQARNRTGPTTRPMGPVGGGGLGEAWGAVAGAGGARVAAYLPLRRRSSLGLVDLNFRPARLVLFCGWRAGSGAAKVREFGFWYRLYGHYRRILRLWGTISEMKPPYSPLDHVINGRLVPTQSVSVSEANLLRQKRKGAVAGKRSSSS